MGAAAAAASRSASAKTMLALLPPSSRVTRLSWSAALRMIPWPTSVDPVKQTLRTSGWLVNRSPTTEPLPGRTVKTPSGMPASSASSPSRIAVSGVSSAGLRTTVLPAASAGREAPAGDGHREVPRHDDGDDAERLLEGDVDAARDGDLLAEEPLRSGGVVREDVPDVPRLPPRVADRVAGVGDLEPGQLLVVLADEIGEPAQQPATVGRGDGPPRGADLDGAGDRRVGLLGADELDRPDDLLGRGVDDVLGARGAGGCRGAHRRSNPLTRSQSVTAELKAASSMSAALT